MLSAAAAAKDFAGQVILRGTGRGAAGAGEAEQVSHASTLLSRQIKCALAAPAYPECSTGAVGDPPPELVSQFLAARSGPLPDAPSIAQAENRGEGLPRFLRFPEAVTRGPP